jgi:glycerophosphoryl diester phosphodiesterase
MLRPVSNLALDELRRHYGYATKRRHGARVEAEIPTLQEFFGWAAQRGSLRIAFLDVKLPAHRVDLVPQLLRRLDALVDRLRPRFRIVLESAHASIIRELAHLAPRYEHALDVEPHVGIVFKAQSCSAARAAIEHRLRHAMPQKPRATTLWPFRTHRRIVRADLELMRRHNARSADAPVQALCSFTINTKKEMEALIDLGVSGIQTDRPDLLRRVALARGRRVDVAP